jgi:hypothetical protein
MGGEAGAFFAARLFYHLHQDGLAFVQGRRLAQRQKAVARRADIDLNRWLKGSYVIPGVQVDAPTPSKPSENDPEQD